MSPQKADIGVVGLAVMGENLILNMESKGFTVACYNRTVSKVDKFVEGRAKDKNIIGTHDLAEFVDSLKRPRKLMVMIKAGEPVDKFIENVGLDHDAACRRTALACGHAGGLGDGVGCLIEVGVL